MLRDRKGYQGHKECQGNEERKDYRGHRARPEKRELGAIKERRATRVTLAPQGPLVDPVLQALKVFQVLLASRESPVRQDLRGRRAREDQQALMAPGGQ